MVYIIGKDDLGDCSLESRKTFGRFNGRNNQESFDLMQGDFVCTSLPDFFLSLSCFFSWRGPVM